MCLNPVIMPNGKKESVFPCGKCFECRLQKSNEWAYRIMLEASLYERNCMITLTYNDANLPFGETLQVRDLQLFLKKLRRKLEPHKIRYFACGEYGSRKGRPHYHIIIFDYMPSDIYYYFTDRKKTDLYRSPFIEKIWTKGFSTIGEVTFDTAKYCAKYMQKDIGKDKKPFITMSKKPGIGFSAIKVEYLFSDKIYHNGRYIKTPRYFLDVLERNGNDLTLLKKKRKKACTGSEYSSKAYIEARRKKISKIFNLPLDKDFNI